MIELHHLCKSYHAGKVHEFSAVSDVTLTIDGERITILKGPSGSGKTTLLTLIGCMARPTSGRIILHGPLAVLGRGEELAELEITSLPERFLTAIRRRTFGFIFQQFNLIKGISVRENIMLPALPDGESHRIVRQRATALMEMFAIGRHASSPVEWLSGGELQRVAIARALINDPAVIIADEPTAHLDSRLSGEFMAIIGNLQRQGKTVVIASHDPLVCDSPLADRVVSMRDGAITGIERRR
jgi:putative ABC transport system ATP-binding protein